MVQHPQPVRVFRGDLEAALPRSDRAKGGRPRYDPVLMFKVLALRPFYTLSDDQIEYQLKDRRSFMRFVGLVLDDPVPDAKTIWLYREQLARAGAAQRLFARFDALYLIADGAFGPDPRPRYGRWPR
jgi:IS5 family transposase